MLKKTITYPTLDGEKITEDFYFNLTKAELIEMEVSAEGGFKSHLERIIASRNGAEIISEMKRLILLSYGVKSDDGKRFIKSQQLRDEFSQTEAFSELFMDLATNAGAAAQFITGVIPKDLAEDVEKLSIAKEVNLPEPSKSFEDYTEEELIKMPSKQFDNLLPANMHDWTRQQLTIAFRRKTKNSQ
jgi:hypothetical protein